MLDRKCTYIEIAEKPELQLQPLAVNRSLTYGTDGYKLAIDRVRAQKEQENKPKQ